MMVAALVRVYNDNIFRVSPMLSYITNMPLEEHAVKIVYETLEPTTELDGIEYLKSMGKLNYTILHELADSDHVIALPLGLHPSGVLAPNREGIDYKTVAYAFIAEYEVRSALKLKRLRQEHRSKIESILLSALMESY